ncbi:DsbC family protein [Vibrio tubiashii]|uniref:DsbC family protein n=1 Tax=Vibrio tubiashii TaxID=29498 RepID=UPI001EFCEF1D|nr:DsbC family protein [Vibrio tubiashii]MCG9576689.1 DsbC family protein [Vibrio tubiashii]
MSKQQREPTSLFTTADGDVFYMGDVFYVDDDGMAHSLGASEKLKQLNVERPIGFKAQDERAVISVFTDYSCGYCVKFHERVLPLMLKAGISVNYFAFPRGGMVTLEANQLAKAWCSDDPQTAISQLKKGVVIEGEASSPMRNCNDDVLQQYISGRLFNITGTPTILTQDGYMIEGLPAISASQAVETEEQLEEWLKMMRVVEVE